MKKQKFNLIIILSIFFITAIILSIKHLTPEKGTLYELETSTYFSNSQFPDISVILSPYVTKESTKYLVYTDASPLSTEILDYFNQFELVESKKPSIDKEYVGITDIHLVGRNGNSRVGIFLTINSTENISLQVFTRNPEYSEIKHYQLTNKPFDSNYIEELLSHYPSIEPLK